LINMKNKAIIGIGLALLLAAVFVYFEKRRNYDPAKAEYLGINETVEYLIGCQDETDQVTQFFCPKVSEKDLVKLHHLRGISANNLCRYWNACDIFLALEGCSLRSQLFACGQKARRP